MLDPVELLLDRLVNDDHGRWPHERHKEARDKVLTWRAFLDSDHDTLKSYADWPADRPYKIDGLPALIADAWADHVFDGDLVITTPTKDDEKNLRVLIEADPEFDDQLREAERSNVAEGERWWRVLRDEDVSDFPFVEWFGRDVVIPHYVGRKLVAAAIVTELERPENTGRGTRWRHLEIHTDGAVEHVLFKGTKTKIGETVPLETHPDLVELAFALGAEGGQGQRWNHGIGWLMGRVDNARGIDPRLKLGRSEYERNVDQLLDLNEAATIGAENARLTAKRRMAIPESALTTRNSELVDLGDGTFERRPAGREWSAGDDVLIVSQIDQELGATPDNTFKVLEYSFDAEALIAYKRDLVETALTRINITPQYAGVVGGEGGLALTGTALKIRLIPTTKGGKGKGRAWDGTLPQIIAAKIRLDALSQDAGGFGRAWSDANVLPVVERPSGLPSDDVEDAQVEATLVQAGVRSRYQSIKAQHDDWTPAQIEEELGRIDADRKASGSAGLLPGFA